MAPGSETERGPSGEAPAGADSAGVRVPPPLIYVVTFASGVGAELAVATPDVPVGVAIVVGVVGLALWMVLDPLAMWVFRRGGTQVPPSRPSSALVSAGPYRISRNPMYLGMLVLYAALALTFAFWWSLALLPFVFAFVDRVVVPREEAYLERRFGTEYRTYRGKVRRWI